MVSRVGEDIIVAVSTLVITILLALIGGYLYNNFDRLNLGWLALPAGLVSFIANVLPFALLMYGFAGDIINSEFRLSVPSIAAILSIIVLGISGRWYAGSSGADLSAQDSTGSSWCTIPGLEQFENPYLPTAFVSTAVIAIYYISWAADVKKSTGSLLMSFGVILMLQLSSFFWADCAPSYIGMFGNVATGIFIATLLGGAIGAISWASVRGKGQFNPFIVQGASASGGPPPVTGPLAQNYSQPVQGGGDENTFVAELYKNGELVTQTISA